MTGPAWQRLDHWLWCARFMKARDACAGLAEAGSIRINRQPTDKAHARLRVGDILTLPLAGRVMVIRVAALAERRGPPAAARLLYEEIVEPGSASIAAHNPCTMLQTPAYATPDAGRPIRSTR
jgi:ribosome-associated heat shock protein Hsp15